MRTIALIREPRAEPSPDTLLAVDGASLRIRDEGQGPAVVLIHGWALTLDMWQPQAEAWSRRCRVVRFDRRGFGGSTGAASLAADAGDVESLLRRLDLDQVVLVGMSQGARVAMQVASGPLAGRVSGLVLDGAPYDATRDGESEVPIEYYRELLGSQGIEAVRAEWRRHPFSQLVTRDPAAHALLAAMTARYDGRDLRPPATPDGTAPGALGTIRAPTLIVNGALDTPRRRAMGEALARALPRAERALVAGAGHLPNLDNPGEYNHRVLSFIERHVGSCPAG